MKIPHLNVEIKEVYKTLKPSYDPQKTVKKLFSGIPQKYTNGIGTIVIRDIESFNRNRKRQKYKGANRHLKLYECGGFYNAAFKGEPAWIELILDQIVPSDCRKIKRLLFLELMIGEVLYHEIGHHIHAAIVPEHKENEKVADEWRDKLLSHYFRRRYGIILFPLWLISLPFKRAINRCLKNKQYPCVVY